MNARLLVDESEEYCKKYFDEVDKTAFVNQERVLNAFRRSGLALRHFSPTTGYAYDDGGREKLKEIFVDIFDCQDALVSPLMASGTHALTLALFGVLRPRDTAVSITGAPYDTLTDVIGKSGIGSLKDFDINFQIASVEDSIAIQKARLVFLQRSRGYEWRDALSTEDIELLINKVRKINPTVAIMVDNCYGEFTETREPTHVGADIVVGSLIKNMGGGLCPGGGYVCGKSEYIRLIAGRLTAPGIGDEIGAYHSSYQPFFQGVFMAPHVVAQALKGAILIGETMRRLGYEVLPPTESPHRDIIKSIKFNTEGELVSFCQTIQSVSPVDSNVTPYPWDMPGYSHKVIMAAGTFVQGASIELSCDAPIKAPFVAYLQGGLTYEHLKLTAINCCERLLSQKS